MNFGEELLKQFEKMKEKDPTLKGITVWDVVVEYLKSKAEPSVLTLTADLPILEKIASGMSASSISNNFAIPSRDVFEVANIWGMTILDSTLDFSPLLMYNDGMSAVEMMLGINEILAIPISLQTATIIINNIERYNGLLEFLDMWE